MKQQNSILVLILLLMVLGFICATFSYICAMIVFTMDMIFTWFHYLNERTKITRKFCEWFYKLSFPYTTDEVIILPIMQVVNWIIGIRFRLLYYCDMIKLSEFKQTDKTIFFDEFYTFDKEKWQTRFPWGDGNNKPENVSVLSWKWLEIQMKKENHRGWWDGWKDYHNTSGMIYSNNTVPICSTYEACIKLSNVNHINQNFWLIGFQDPPLERKIAEIDIFEYHLSENKITMSQHWGNCYDDQHFPDRYHKQDSFAIRIDLQDDKFHNFKFKCTKRNMYWYIDGILVKWHFLGIPKYDLNIISGMGNGGVSEDCTNTGKLNLDELPTQMYINWIKVEKNK